YVGGLVPGLTCGWLALKTHFWGSAEERAAAVSLLGLRAPLGAWMTIWGAFTMLLSAPFDNWWHDAYGLDVQILSPPHTVLSVGMFGVALGVLLLMLSLQNRSGTEQGSVRFPFILTAGVMLVMAAVFLTEESYPNQQHTSTFYKVSCATYPLYLLAAARASKLRWPATTMAAVYMGIVMLMAWWLPLFPAQPKLAPIYNRGERMVAPPFPLLLIAPAFALDLLLRWLGGKSGLLRDSLLAGLAGLLFLGIFLAVQWHFSTFLLGHGGQNWFFASDRIWPYTSRMGQWQYEFWNTQPTSRVYDPVTWRGLIMALAWGVISARIGLALGHWMARVKR